MLVSCRYRYSRFNVLISFLFFSECFFWKGTEPTVSAAWPHLQPNSICWNFVDFSNNLISAHLWKKSGFGTKCLQNSTLAGHHEHVAKSTNVFPCDILSWISIEDLERLLESDHRNRLAAKVFIHLGVPLHHGTSPAILNSTLQLLPFTAHHSLCTTIS